MHLSDLHIGNSSQWLWPNFKHIFLNDVKRLSDKIGTIDLVIFSGDLTNTGSADEYRSLTNELNAIWELWDKAEMKPKLFTVPGNHDLFRPDQKDAAAKILSLWGNDQDVINEFWNEPDNQYLKLVRKSFLHYENWLDKINSTGIPFAPITKGILPGDISSNIEINNISVGLVGLNSSFLQISGNNYFKKLALSARQLNAVTNNDPPSWCNKNEVNFLVTHHPTAWLNKESQSEFNSEIYPSGRFTAHLYGHMHEAELTNQSYGGSEARKTFQSASLFGLEHTDGKLLRSHGYSVGQISFDDNEVTWKLWPRKGIVAHKTGDRKIIPDHEAFEIVSGEEYQLEKLQTKNSSKSLIVAPKLSVDLSFTVEEASSQWKRALDACTHPLTEQEQHLAIRPLEQQICIESIHQDAITWVCSDWGLGRDGFIWSVLKKVGRDSQPVYQISLSEYQSRDDFQAQFSTSVGCSFPEFCKALAASGPAFLLFDDVPVTTGEAKGLPVERDIENLASTIKDFCPEIAILLLARTKPQYHTHNAVTLEPLDEADTKTYLEAHPHSTSETKTSNAVSQIYRCTDGLPSKIDSTLKTLRVIPLSELEPAHLLDPADYSVLKESVPFSLVKAVTTLSTSKDSSSKRSYLLLKSLSILPQGESLDRLKRIDNQIPIFPKHAEELLDNDLIQVRTSTTFIGSDKDETRLKILFAPRQVRDYVLSLMTTRETDSLVKKAINLYFGEKWRSGEATLKKIESRLISEDGSLMENPHNIVMRLLKSTLADADLPPITPILSLCKIYCNALYAGRHYRNCVTVCRDILSTIPETETETINIVKTILARSLRMIGDYSAALPLLEKLLDTHQSNQDRAKILLSYALCLQSLNDPKAIGVAKEVMALLPKSASALQAKAILIEMEHDADSSTDLLKLEKKARASGYNTVANNLALDRVSDSSSDYDSLRTVYSTSLEVGDNYNACRATVKLGKLLLKDTGNLPSIDLNNLIKSYQYFYGERFKTLFSQAHRILWDYFEKRNDVKNLLILFRHSSFIWRLNGDEDNELIYIQSLTASARNILNTDILKADKNTSYFLVRAKNVKLITEKHNND